MNHIKHTAEFQLDQPADILFPLFSAEGEKLWVPDWDYKNIMGSTQLHEDYIFVTGNHDHAAGDAIWLVKRYDPDNYYVGFYKVEPEEKVGIIAVKCDVLSESRTNISITYEYKALNEKGNKFISNYTDQEHRKFIGEWKQLLDNYFETQV